MLTRKKRLYNHLYSLVVFSQSSYHPCLTTTMVLLSAKVFSEQNPGRAIASLDYPSAEEIQKKGIGAFLKGGQTSGKSP